MSRLPQPSSSRTTYKAQLTPGVSPAPRSVVSPVSKARAKTPTPAAGPPTATPSPLRTRKSQPNLKPTKAPLKSPARAPQPLPDPEPLPPPPKLSIREQIALKRAEVQKSARNTPTPTKQAYDNLEDASPTTYGKPEADVDLGRWSVKETIERARSSGAINLASRQLPCLPSALFEIHLSITPEPLKSVPEEPPITTSTSDDPAAIRRRAGNNDTSWYEAKDLEIIKAWSNEILEIQPEISMFGSLKVIDLHNNKLKGLPDAFADLVMLTTLDLSHNELVSLPEKFWTMPGLITLNLSHNQLIALPFSAPFVGSNHDTVARTKDARGDWFSAPIIRATEPLPRLTTLDASHNRLTARLIDHAQDGPGLPILLSKLDLSENPLGRIDSMLRSLSKLTKLSELKMQRADVADDSFPVALFSGSSAPFFPSLKLLDMEETHVTRPVVEAAFASSSLRQTLDFEVTNSDPPIGVLRVVIGKRVIKEAWEVEAEQKIRVRGRFISLAPTGTNAAAKLAAQPVVKEPWEDAQMSEGAKRRARAQAAAAAAQSSSPPPVPTPAAAPAKAATTSRPAPIKVIEKEAWEIEAEQGLNSAGARRRARAAAVEAATAAPPTKSSSPTPAPSASPPPATLASALSNPAYYNASTFTLTLPTSTPPAKAAHTRSFSLATWSKARDAAPSDLALAIPTPTLPLAAIVSQPLAQTLKILILANRRNDPCFSIPTLPGAFLPWLEELSLANCNLGDTVPVSHVGADGQDELGSQRLHEPLLPLIARLFPSLRTLDLSYNSFTSDAFPQAALAEILIADAPRAEGEEEGGPPRRKGLRQLNLRGNRINGLEGFQGIAEMFKGNRVVAGWVLEELDLRDNEIGKLPAELGLLPLDVFLVDGNMFRVPPRRVWEREGTKGLLSWLRGRIE